MELNEALRKACDLGRKRPSNQLAELQHLEAIRQT